MGYFNAFSGGIIFASGLLYLLPKAHKLFKKDKKTYPFVYLIASLSFSFILFIERIAFDTYDNTYMKEEKTGANN